MLTDDVDWLFSTVTADPSGHQVSAAKGLALLPAMARVTYEGMELVKRDRSGAGHVVALEFGDVIAAARHSAKLLDDTRRSYADVVDELETIRIDHLDYFRNSLLAAIVVDDKLVATSRGLSYQTRWNMREAVGDPRDRSPHYQLAREMGEAMGRVVRAFGHVPRAVTINSSAGLAVRAPEVDSSEWARQHYGERIRVADADILMLSESAVNTALTILEPAAEAFPGPVFRARMVTLFHAVGTVSRCLDANFDELRAGAALREAVALPEAAQLLSLTRLRNRCMHYGAPASLVGLSTSLPAYGLVEATSPGTSFAEVNGALLAVLQRLSEAFGAFED